MENKNKPIVLIVDDVPKNLQLLGTILYQNNYEIAMADSGKSALAALEETKPDLILLDIMMPEMDGFEVCEIIKSKEENKEIPVIFLTAKTDVDNIVRGFDIGALDYITKPFNANELLARVKTHIELKKSKESLLEYSQQLEIMLRQRSEFLGIAAHDMKNPLSSIIGLANNAINFINESEVSDSSLQSRLTSSLKGIRDTSIYMFRTVSELLNVETLESGKLIVKKSECSISSIIASVLLRNILASNAKKIKIFVKIFNEALVFGDEERLREIVDNLISNAIKYSPLGKNIYVELSPSKNHESLYYKFSVKDEGIGLTDEDKKHVFERFRKLSAKPTGGESSSGLGLSIVKKLTELHGGEVGFDSVFGEGAEFYVILPAYNMPQSDAIYNFLSSEFVRFSGLTVEQSNNKAEVLGIINNPSNFVFDEIQKAKLPEVVTTIEDNILGFWNKIIKSNIINDIIRFSIDIRDLGKQTEIKILETYGSRLNEEARNFDIENLPLTLGYFPDIVGKLKDCLS